MRTGVLRVITAACALGACQVVSGASALAIFGGDGVTDGGEGVTDGGLDAKTRDVDVDARADADASTPDAAPPFPACAVEAGGTFTVCQKGGLPPSVAGCVEFCALQQKCCAEDCQANTPADETHHASFVADTEMVCSKPLSGSANGIAYTSCNDSPIPEASRFFKCCCR